MATCCLKSSIRDLPDKPHQPLNFKFPSRCFGQSKPVNRSFQAGWFQRFPWIHYVETTDCALCFTCCKATKQGKVRVTGVTEDTFLVKGFTNWKDATRVLSKHEASDFHKQAVAAMNNQVDVGEIQHAKEKEINREYLLNILSIIRLLARQGLPLRGDADEKDSNFYQLMLLQAEKAPVIKNMLERKHFKYTSHEIQNELLCIMAQQVLRKVVPKLQSSFFTIMIDETTDASNVEQVVIVIRNVDDDLSVCEEFIGLYQTHSIQANSLAAIIKDTFSRLNLSIEFCRGQCYDGASVMTGSKNGVAKIISNDEPRAVFTHCYGHSLNLAVGDTVKQCKIMKSALETVNEISKLIKKSPKRDAMFQRIKQGLAQGTPGFRVLCPTRWTVRAASLQSVLDNYKVLLEVWEESKESSLDSKIKARVIGVEAQMLTFDFLFGISLGAIILNHSDNLSKSLQQMTLSASEGQYLAKHTLEALKSIRQPEHFDLFFKRVLLYQEEFQVDSPRLPRKRRAPRQIQIGSSDGDFHTSIEEYYRAIYYEAIDFVIEAITDRFDQPGYKVYQNIEELLIKVCQGKPYEDELTFVCTFYKGDLDKHQLQVQLPVLHSLVSEKLQSGENELTIPFVITTLSELSTAQRVCFSQVFVLAKLLLVMPATNASSERSFSALRRVKTYLRSTMTQLRLNNLMVLHIHKDKTDHLNLKEVGNEFVGNREVRMRHFGRFS